MGLPVKSYNKIEIIQSIFLVIGSVFLQTFLVPVLEINVWRPDLILIVTIIIGYKYGAITGILIGFILGLIQDSISVSPIGLSSLANCIIGFLSGNIKEFKLGSYGAILFTILFMLIHGLIFYALYQFKTETTYSYLILTRVFPNTIYSFIIWLFISFIFKPFMEE